MRAQIESLRAALLEGASFAPSHESQTSDTHITEVTLVIEQAIAANRSDPSAHVRASFRSGTCPICAVQSQAIFNFFAQWQYTLSKDVASQHAFAAARGFCAFHTWQFAQIASPRGISEGYALLIDAAMETLRVMEQSREHLTEYIEGLLPSVERCAACRVLREVEEEQLRLLVAQLATADGRKIYARTPGLCFPHLRATFASAQAEAVTEFLLHEQSQRLEEISEDMRSYTLKRDALRRGLLNDHEEEAWRRALVQLVGERNIRAV